MKSKLFPLISILIIIIIFGTAATCNMCEIDLSTGTTETSTSITNTDETFSESSTETTIASTIASETSLETTEDFSQDVELFDVSQLEAVFAMANDPGDTLITFYSDLDESKLKEINVAIGEDGQFYQIEYENKQDSNAQDSFRVVADNFDNMEGYIYSVTGNNLVANNTYFLCNSEVIKKENLLTTVNSGIGNIDEETKIQIENTKGLSLQDDWIIDEYSDGKQILIVVFEPSGNDLLMSIVLKQDNVLKFIDFPATLDGYSAWRVDDGGEINPNLFQILFTAKTTEGLLINICWIGAEGQSIFFLLEGDDTLQRLPIDVSRYTSPG